MKVEILFPEVGNLCGDLMNIRYLRQCCPELEVVETDLKSRPAFWRAAWIWYIWAPPRRRGWS